MHNSHDDNRSAFMSARCLSCGGDVSAVTMPRRGLARCPGCHAPLGRDDRRGPMLRLGLRLRSAVVVAAMAATPALATAEPPAQADRSSTDIDVTALPDDDDAL